MAWKKEFIAEDGRKIILRDLNKRDTARKLMNYINTFVDEKTYLLMDKKATLADQKKWLNHTWEKISKKTGYYLVMEDSGRMVGSVSAERQLYKLRGNVLLGITIKRQYRGVGLGYFAMSELIKRVRKEMKPRNIYLTLYSGNKAAHKLYSKLGFKYHHTLKNWVNHYGKYLEEDFLILGS